MSRSIIDEPTKAKEQNGNKTCSIHPNICKHAFVVVLLMNILLVFVVVVT